MSSSPDSTILELTSTDVECTQQLAFKLAGLLRGDEIICLQGSLGAGKTAFAQGLGQGFGIKEPINSPTFTLIQEYQAKDRDIVMYHIDLYRLESADEVHMLGLDDYLYGAGICVIEWPEQATNSIPNERLWIKLEVVANDHRTISLHAHGEPYQRLLTDFKQLICAL